MRWVGLQPNIVDVLSGASAVERRLASIRKICCSVTGNEELGSARTRSFDYAPASISDAQCGKHLERVAAASSSSLP